MDRPIGLVSPCIGLCQLDERKVCLGCLRTIDEIVTWSTMSSNSRLEIMKDLIDRRTSRDSDKPTTDSVCDPCCSDEDSKRSQSE